MSDSDSWCTPTDVIDPLLEFFDGPVEVDPCSNETSVVKAIVAYTYGGLHRPWCLPRPKKRTCYENYPYSMGDAWTRKMLLELGCGNVLEHVRLVMACTSTQWWGDQCNKSRRNPRILFTKRLAFIIPPELRKNPNEKPSSARFEPALVYYGPRATKFERTFRHITRWTAWGR